MTEDESTEEDVNEDETADNESEEEYNYVLCPICHANGETYGFETIGKLSGHFSGAHTHKTGEQWSDFKKQVIYTNDKPANLSGKKAKLKKRTDPKSDGKDGQGGRMTQDEDEIEPELGEAAAVKGKIRQIIMKFTKMDDAELTDLMPQREQLVSFMKSLSVANPPYELIEEIRSKIESDILPRIRQRLGEIESHDDDNDGSGDGAHKATMDIRMKAQKLKSKMNVALQQIANLPSHHQEELIVEKSAVIESIRKLYKENITKKEVNEIEANFSAYQPFIESVVNKGKKKKKDSSDFYDDDDDDVDILTKRDIKDARREDELLRFEVRKAENRERLDEIKNRTRSAGQPTAQYQVQERIKIDPTTGQVMLDEDGKPMTEHVYINPTQQGGDSITTALMAAIIPTLITNAKGNDGGLTIEKYMELRKMERLERDNEKLQDKINNPNPAGSQHSEEMKEMRIMIEAEKDRRHEMELANIERQMTQFANAANRDQVGELLEEKARLIQLGLAQEPGSGQEDPNVTFANKALNETIARADTAIDRLQGIAGPLQDIAKDRMKMELKRDERRMEREDAEHQQSHGPQHPQGPPQLSREEKNRRWRDIANAVDEEQ